MKPLPSHTNDGHCLRCAAIIMRYPNFHPGLLSWFIALQAANPEAHVSCAGRGELEQEAVKARGASMAAWKDSAHNWNAALDLFCMAPGMKLYPTSWFHRVVGGSLTPELEWYGAVGASYPELPHVQVRGWRLLAHQGVLSLVS